MKQEPDKEDKEVLPRLNPELPEPVESDALYVPYAAQKLHGCCHCEWRTVNLCPHGYSASAELMDLKDGEPKLHSKGICQARINWLQSFTAPGVKRPTFSKWQRDFNRAMGQTYLLKDHADLQKSQQELIKLERMESVSPKLIRQKKDEYTWLRKRFLDMWKELAKIDESQMNREQPKKIDIEVKTKIPISEMQRIMRENAPVIDAEFSVIEEEEKDGKEEEERDN